ncbi:MAG: 4-hydroxyphenylacetate 3-hydroxylase N-terminal domain-containing protein [Planctomycetota bacterium]|nr:4-hydroxyphenylacetate 3-hydroxylase N-terminal domain-containing protein [Planctomycetota bacterium]
MSTLARPVRAESLAAFAEPVAGHRDPLAGADSGETGAPLPAGGQPRSGAAYLASLRDERQVYIQGQRVRDVTSHPALANAARSIARLYDALSDPKLGGLLTTTSDTPARRPTHAFFKASRSREELVRAGQAIATWARLTYGWMGRSPDYKASLTSTLGPNGAFYGPLEANARRWYSRAQDELPFLGHAIANAPVDRHLDTAQTKDVCVRVVGETSEGIRVRGAKVVATSAAIANACFVGHTPSTVSDDPEMSVSFIAPLSTPGVKLVCRASYEHAASAASSPFDHPLSSRFDENDCILIFDDALIPWEDVLIHRDPERVRRFFPESGFVNTFLFHGCTRFAVKLDFIAGLLSKALRCTGGHKHRGNKALLGEVVAWRHTFWSLARAMSHNPDAWVGGAVLPQKEAALAYCVLAPDCYPRLKDIVHRVIASGLVYLPSTAADLGHPDLRELMPTYMRGTEGIDHRQRTKIMKLLSDAVLSEFAGRHELYERNYSGGWEAIRLMVAGEAARTGAIADLESLADACMSDYDERGWTNDAWKTTNPTGVERCDPFRAQNGEAA